MVPAMMFFEPCFLAVHPAKEYPAFIAFNLVRGFLTGTPAMRAYNFNTRH